MAKTDLYGFVCTSMRIRTDGDYGSREDTIEKAADFYERNKTESLLRAADDVPELVDGIQEVLQRHDLTYAQRQDIADCLSTRHFEFEWTMGHNGPEANVKPD